MVEELTRYNAELPAFAHTVAHDLTEPLRSIWAFTPILVCKAQLAEADKDIAKFIIEGVRRMSTLLEDLLSPAKIVFSDSLQPVNLRFAGRRRWRI